MSLNKDSRHYDAYYKHIDGTQKATGYIAKVYDIIEDISDRSGLNKVWENIDGDVQDGIIDTWSEILNK